MAKIEEWTKVEDGTVMGYVRTNKVGSDCEFEICSIEEWKELTEEEAEKLALDALWESGMIEWGY